MSEITTHVLDAVLGRPAVGVIVVLEYLSRDGWTRTASGSTDTDGRCLDLCRQAEEGTYRLTFAIVRYFKEQARESIYPEIAITFVVDGLSKYHIPLLLSDNSYTTYRGS